MKQQLLLFVGTALLVCLVTPSFNHRLRDAPVWSNCTQRGGPLTILNVTLTPKIPVENENLDVLAYYNLDEDITGGMVHVNLNAGGLPVIIDNDLCAALRDVGINDCNFSKGREQKLEIKIMFPDFGISGQVSGNVTADDQRSKQFICISLNFYLQPGK